MCKVKFEVVGFIECNFRLVPNFFSCGTSWYLLNIMGKKMKKWGVSENGMPIGNSFFETPLNNWGKKWLGNVHSNYEKKIRTSFYVIGLVHHLELIECGIQKLLIIGKWKFS